MKLKQTTINELGLILKEEYGVRLRKKELFEFAYFLIEYFSTLSKMYQQQKFEHRPSSSIDKLGTKDHDNGEYKYED
jgi:hypothetical protein